MVGGSAAGLRAAARARRCLENAKILVIDQDEIISYAACGLPYFLPGDIENGAKLRETPYGQIRDPEFFLTAKGLEVLTKTRVERIDREARKVFCKSVETGEEAVFAYDRLVLATGAVPIMLPGVPKDSRRIMTFKTLPDAARLHRSLERGEIGKVGIVGAGYIGCELSEAFGALWGAEVVLIEAAPSILPKILDREMAAPLEAYLKSMEVEVHTGSAVEEIAESDSGVTIRTKDGSYEVDYAVVDIGVKPNTALAAACGLEIGESGGVEADGKLCTSAPRIFAAGDCVAVKARITGRPCLFPLGSLANRQGRVVGSNLAGKEETFGPVAGSAAVKLFDMNVSVTGLTESAALKAGFDAACAWGTFTDKAEYFPDAENIHLKIVFEKGSGRLLGLQGYGKGEVVKRVDVFTSLLKSEGNLEDLLDAEFAYAPPYAPAVDPLFVLAAIARNAVMDGIEGLTPVTALDARTIVDVRSANETKGNPVTGAEVIHIPFEEIRARWQELPSDKPLLTVCSKGPRSAESIRILRENGLTDAVYLGGGILMRP